MKRGPFGAVLILLVVACSACGSSARVVTTTRHPAAAQHRPAVPFALPSAVNLVILPPIHGTGNERLGTFTPRGAVDFEVSCKGKGELSRITIVRIAALGLCDGSPTGVRVPPGEEGKPMNVVVRTAPGTTWRLAIGEEIPGAHLLLVHSSGVGSRSFGTFAIHGKLLHYETACRGPGTVRVEFLFLETNAGRGSAGNCLGLSHDTAGDIDVQGGRVQISVDAPRKTRWSLTVTER